MICDVTDVNKFLYYKSKEGPFVITFFHQDHDGSNFKFYSILKSLEKDYNDIPLIRYDYHKFRKIFILENIPSPNHLMVIKKYENTKYYEMIYKNYVEKILQSIRGMLFMCKIMRNKAFKFGYKKSIRTWIVGTTGFRSKDIKRFVDMPAEIQYKFPNCTAFGIHESSNSLEHLQSPSPLQIPISKISPTLLENRSITPKWRSNLKLEFLKNQNKILKNSDKFLKLTPKPNRVNFSESKFCFKHETEFSPKHTKSKTLKLIYKSQNSLHHSNDLREAVSLVSLSSRINKNTIESRISSFEKNKIIGISPNIQKIHNLVNLDINKDKNYISNKKFNKNNEIQYTILNDHNSFSLPLDLSKKRIENNKSL